MDKQPVVTGGYGQIGGDNARAAKASLGTKGIEKSKVTHRSLLMYWKTKGNCSKQHKGCETTCIKVERRFWKKNDTTCISDLLFFFLVSSVDI